MALKSSKYQSLPLFTAPHQFDIAELDNVYALNLCICRCPLFAHLTVTYCNNEEASVLLSLLLFSPASLSPLCETLCLYNSVFCTHTSATVALRMGCICFHKYTHRASPHNSGLLTALMQQH